MSSLESGLIGRVTRCSTRGFVGAARLPQPEMPVFGTFCKAAAQQGRSTVIGLIYDISIQDDELARQLATVDDPPLEQVIDNRFLRQVPVEYAALAVGYQNSSTYYYSLPPQPPLTLTDVTAMSAGEIIAFTTDLRMIPLVLSAAEIPADDLVAAALNLAAAARPANERKSFLIEAARVCARLLARDLSRLDRLTRNLSPLTEAQR